MVGGGGRNRQAMSDPTPDAPVSRSPIDAVKTKTLRLVPDERGWLMEILRSDDELFRKFGQASVSATYPGVVKAWHYRLEPHGTLAYDGSTVDG